MWPTLAWCRFSFGLNPKPYKPSFANQEALQKRVNSRFNTGCLFLLLSCLIESCAFVSCATLAWWRPSGLGGRVIQSDTPSPNLWIVTESWCLASNLLTYRSTLKSVICFTAQSWQIILAEILSLLLKNLLLRLQNDGFLEHISTLIQHIKHGVEAIWASSLVSNIITVYLQQHTLV